MRITKGLFRVKKSLDGKYTTRTKGKIKIHFNPSFSGMAYVQLGNKENLIQFHNAINHQHIPEFSSRHIPWQHYDWLLAWRPVVQLFDERMRETTSQNKLLLVGMIPPQPPAEPLNRSYTSKLNNYRKRIGDR